MKALVDSAGKVMVGSDGKVATDDCPGTCCGTGTGACCVGTDCSILSEADCTTALGVYQGDDTVCDPNPCCAIGEVISVRLQAHVYGSYSNDCGISFDCNFDETWVAGTDWDPSLVCIVLSVLQRQISTTGCETCAAFNDCADGVPDGSASSITAGFSIIGSNDPPSLDVEVISSFDCFYDGAGGTFCDGGLFCGTGAALNSGNGGTANWTGTPIGEYLFSFTDTEFGVTIDAILTVT